MKNAPSQGDRIASRIPFFYGWLMLPVVTAIQVSTSPGQTYGVSVFNPHWRADLGLSHSELSGAYMLGTLLASLPMTYVGSLMDRYGSRKVLAAVVASFGLVCAGVSQVGGLVTLFVAFLLLRMLGQGAIGLLGMNTLAMWFNRRLGFASGISSLGFTAAMAAIPALNLWLIASYGWRLSYMILGATVWIVVLPVLGVLFRDRPEDVGQKPDGFPWDPRSEPGGHDAAGRGSREAGPVVEAGEAAFDLAGAMRTRAYWIVAAASAAWSMIVTGIMFHMVQLFLDSGLTEGDAAAAFTTIAISMAVSRFAGGIMADRLPLNVLLTVALACSSGATVLLVRMSSFWSAQVFAAVRGASSGMMMAVSTTLWVRYYGRSHLGRIRGSLTTIGVAASSLGPFVMGYAHDVFGRFDEALWVFVAVFGVIAAFGLFATPPQSRGHTGCA
ncbi:MAG: MFS transporter [Candidatus Latescibacteria bacterium]|jgi:MFS family permease|nr:MFS transporter [Candidatus Latescibacterota bacterium]